MIKAILFDFDGTVVDSLKHYLVSFRRTFDHFGVKLTDREIIDQVFYDPTSQKKIFSKHRIDEEKFWKKADIEVEKVFKGLSLHDHIDVVLQQLCSLGLKLAIVSNAPGERVRSHITRLKSEHYFDLILGRYDVKEVKPDPEMVQLVMKTLLVTPEETLLIGDTDMDILTGKNAGILTGLFLPTTNRLYSDIDLYRQSNPDFEFQSYLQLPDEIKRLQKLKAD